VTPEIVLVLDSEVREAILAVPRTVRRFMLMYAALWTVLTLAFFLLLLMLHGGHL
jgi:hypothetical protein